MKTDSESIQGLPFHATLPFKIGVVIVLAQIAVLGLLGWFYADQYAATINRAVRDRVSLPGSLMSRGLLGIDAMNDRETIEDLVKGSLRKGLVVGLNRVVFSSLDPDDIGRSVDEISGVDLDILDFDNPESVVVYNRASLIAVVPVYGYDGRTLRFFTYLHMSTAEAAAMKARFVQLFLLGGVVTVLATSLIILVTFRYLISRRIRSLLDMVHRVEWGELGARDESYPFRDELGLLQQGVNSMAARLEETLAFLEEQIRRRTSHLNTVARLAEELNTIHDQEDLLRTVVQRLQRNFNYYQAHIFIHEDGALRHRAGSPEFQVSHPVIPVNAEVSMVAQACRSGRMVIVNDIRASGESLPEPNMPDGYSEIAVPLLHEGKVLGVLNVQRKEPGGLDDSDINLLRTLAGHLAVTLDNVRLFRKLQEQSHKLVEANEQLEERVSRRTRALQSANDKLRLEIQERRQVEDMLRHSQKIEVIGRLTGGVVHDFNNALTVILTNCDLLLQQEDMGDPGARRRLEQMRGAAEQAAALTSRLLSFGRQQGREPRVLDVNAVIRELDPIIRRILGENIRLESILDDALPAVYMDRGLFDQVLVNLVVQARGSMEGKGLLRIRTSAMDLDERDCRACRESMQPGRYVVMEFRDTGKGLDEEELSGVFDPHAAMREGEHGSLGLSTVHGIVRQMGGCVMVARDGEDGTLYRVFLPASARGAGEDAEAAEEEQASVGGSETVLLVEDESLVRDVTRAVLEDMGYEVHEAEDAAKALDILTNTDQDVDLLMTDIRMPGEMNGFELAREVIRLLPHIKVLFMSGYVDVEVPPEQQDHFIQKPFAIEEMLDKVREVLDET